jgi:hypothetical protein
LARSGPALHGSANGICIPSATRAASSWQTGVVAGRASFRTARERSYEPHPGRRPRSINRPSPVDVPYDERDAFF